MAQVDAPEVHNVSQRHLGEPSLPQPAVTCAENFAKV